MDEDYPTCPECGYALSLTKRVDLKTKEILINCFCEGLGEDEYHLQIQTGLTQDNITRLEKVGDVSPAKIVLMERKADPYPDI